MSTTARHAEQAAAAALVGAMDATTRRLTLRLLWRMTSRSKRAAASLVSARPYAPKGLKGLAAEGGAR